jgi:DNA-binding NarL/FixJ family response regulator
MESRRSILIAHRHVPVRLGIRSALRASRFDIVGEAGEVELAVELALRERPALCLLDLDMPGGGIRAAREISSRVPETTVVMLGVSDGDSDLLGAIRAGAVGVVRVDLDSQRLSNTLECVLAGEAAVPRRLVMRVVDALRSEGHRSPVLPGRPSVEITRREWEVMELMHEGLTTGETADRLLVSPVTVRRHLSNVVRKLEVVDRGDALHLLGERL